MLKGINQSCFPAGYPLAQLFAVSREAGYEAVELNVYPADGVGLTMDSTAREAEAIGRMARDHGLQLRSLSTGLLWKHSLSSADESVRLEGRSIVVKQLELAETLGMDSVLVVPGAVKPDIPYDVCYEQSRRELEALAKEAEKRKVRIGIENVWNKFLLSPLEMRSFVDELDSPYIGVYFDVGNAMLHGFPEQWIRILGHRVFKVHVKDYRTTVGTSSGFVPLLSGHVDWFAVAEALRGIGYADTITAEVGVYGKHSTQLVYDTARHMDIILGGKDIGRCGI